ncbi:hypothetical protein BDK51DRAFT_31917 [Blyttiomyces helicus]|uniref:Uncharacterized protein n=1 Tax=Blyttiomyces helicus TaxID=388810 RepID=A0A4P9VZ63_9FUNG|nr:hypothetical protein BDK51DRAFT_31917 [Blyttiomyces helicus]|eukprot:RKO84275.1 hypothetical protein BDK51DRAFT_31917 [Blyttiomyces helicus]
MKKFEVRRAGMRSRREQLRTLFIALKSRLRETDLKWRLLKPAKGEEGGWGGVIGGWGEWWNRQKSKGALASANRRYVGNCCGNQVVKGPMAVAESSQTILRSLVSRPTPELGDLRESIGLKALVTIQSARTERLHQIFNRPTRAAGCRESTAARHPKVATAALLCFIVPSASAGSNNPALPVNGLGGGCAPGTGIIARSGIAARFHCEPPEGGGEVDRK